ncbi:MAG: GNAT family N-acetyltransferase [Deltaproteobacteria bacterium]|nr:GNAT family N-acetyltransferase [Deltaproteobacteria bacterium]
MSDDPDSIVIREILLSEIAPPGRGEPGWLYEDFRTLHSEWTARGASRWLGLLRQDGPHPVVVFGAFTGRSSPRLVGAVVGVWASAPVARFDDLFEGSGAASATRRPPGGVWHFIAVTTDPTRELRGLGLGRLLLGRALSWARDRGHEEVRTLSPALGLPELVASWPGDLIDAVRTSARPDGRPVLQVLRLHLGGGARLERVLVGSRRDDRASGAVTLRFVYPTDPTLRQERRAAFQAWCDARASAIREGEGVRLEADLYRVETPLDGVVILEGPSVLSVSA